MDPCWQRYRLNILFRFFKRDGIGRRGVSRKLYVEREIIEKFRKLKTTVHRQLYHIISKLNSSKTIHKRWTVDDFPINTYCIFKLFKTSQNLYLKNYIQKCQVLYNNCYNCASASEMSLHGNTFNLTSL